MTLEQALADIETLKAKVSEKDAELKAFQETQRTNDIQALATKSGREFTEAEMADMKVMDATSFKMMASFIPAKAEQPTLPHGLFEEQALNGKNANPIDDLDANITKWAGE